MFIKTERANRAMVSQCSQNATYTTLAHGFGRLFDFLLCHAQGAVTRDTQTDQAFLLTILHFCNLIIFVVQILQAERSWHDGHIQAIIGLIFSFSYLDCWVVSFSIEILILSLQFGNILTL